MSSNFDFENLIWITIRKRYNVNVRPTTPVKDWQAVLKAYSMEKGDPGCLVFFAALLAHISHRNDVFSLVLWIYRKFSELGNTHCYSTRKDKSPVKPKPCAITLSSCEKCGLGNRWEYKGDIKIDDMISSGTLFVGLDTAFGSLYLGYGDAAGSSNGTVYLFLGQPFHGK